MFCYLTFVPLFSGGVDLLEAIPDPANVVPVTFSSRRITRGTSDLMRFRLAHDGVPSPPIDQNAAAEQVRRKVIHK